MSVQVYTKRTCALSLKRNADGKIVCTGAKWIEGYDLDTDYANPVALELPKATGPRTTWIYLGVPSDPFDEIEREEVLTCLGMLLGALGFERRNDQWIMRCLENGNLSELVEAVNRSRWERLI